MGIEYWEKHREAGQRMIDVANAALKGFGVEVDDELPIEAMGERPVIEIEGTDEASQSEQ